MNDQQTLEDEIKALIVRSLNLEDVRPEEIETDAPLFGEGLGLDSIDALELGLALKKAYGITLTAESEILTGDFEIPAEKLRWDGLLYEDYDIDSIDAVDMIVQMRPHLNGKRLAPEDFKSVKTLGDVVRVIARVLDEPAA